MKKCLFCQEEIQDTAVKCRYCGEWLDKKDDPTLNKDDSNDAISTPQDQLSQQSKIIATLTEKPNEKIISYAGFWKRLAAFAIDFIIISIGFIPIAFIFYMLFANADPSVAENKVKGMGLIFSWLYFALRESSPKQGTVGKMMLGIKVTDLDGNRISFARANGRYWGKLISAIILGFGFIMITFTKKKQGLHDIMASCLVVNGDPENATSDDATTEKMSHGEEINKKRMVATVVFVFLLMAAFIATYIKGYFTGKTIAFSIGDVMGLTVVPLIAYILYLVYPTRNKAKYFYYTAVILFIIMYVFSTIYVLEQNAQVHKEAPKIEAPEAPLPPQVLTAVDWFNKAYALSDGKKFSDPPKAIEYLDNAIKIKPDYAVAYNSRGLAYDNIGKYQSAIENYNEAIRLQPDYVNAFSNRGMAHGKLGQHQLAIKDCNDAIRLKPDLAVPYNNRGLSYYYLGKYQSAIKDYSEAIRLQPDYASAYNNRGNTYLNQGNKKKGCLDAQKACQLGVCKTLEWAKVKGLCRQ